ncbi:MAG TPA: hypothetical protein VNN80_25300 [Polyangiaceae bacterium]|nr:hypothetical protein [Polyangiaceae bacterium]
MKFPQHVSGLRAGWVFWVGALVTSAACGSDPSPPRPVAAEVGAAGSGGGASVEDGELGGAGGAPAVEPAPSEEPVSNEADAGVPPDTGPCALGETRECSFDLLCTGVATCGSDGTFGACDCGSLPLDAAGLVGARCATDADCSGGATCLRADGNEYRGVGGPAGGYCTFSCTLEADDCASRDPQSFCAPIGPEETGYCIRTCLSQDPEAGEAKCLNRNDVVCLSIAADGFAPFDGTRQQGVCQPMCGSDEECPAGRVCHAQAHFCTDGQIPGAPIGAACTLDSNCSGYACEDRDAEGVGVCTASCVLGSLSGCGYGREPSSRDAACLTPFVAAGRFSEGVGDLGLCRELCDVPEDCEQAAAGWICTPINEGAAEFFGRSGACVPPG